MKAQWALAYKHPLDAKVGTRMSEINQLVLKIPMSMGAFAGTSLAQESFVNNHEDILVHSCLYLSGGWN